jgi:hypothetical protein
MASPRPPQRIESINHGIHGECGESLSDLGHGAMLRILRSGFGLSGRVGHNAGAALDSDGACGVS